ncbi:DUF1003 domain-containing protein [Granulicella sp. WH15]|uniref:DUF1003 domain-containing protein n=1 Tax=Granulicella sp. WH15 TaxID=2602070 RepID=UPI0013675F7E|nr:DUF1003 domain-containing protein [Granulicella sp. WH15]QHN04109.1 DUF1003 domain-containing protein [Granulicella sp. WH15]
MSQSHVQEHIDLIAKHEQDFLSRRTRAEKLSDEVAGFAGSLAFVGLHLVIFAAWITLNSLKITQLHHFDPPPYSLLSTIVALEALLLASFILIRQSRIGRRGDERDHLMLQILLLSEREITAVLEMSRQLAKQAGLGRVADQPEIKELSEQTSIEDMAKNIQENIQAAE